MELEIRQRSTVARLPLPDDRSFRPPRRGKVPIEAALRHVQLGADEELRFRRPGLKSPLGECGPWCSPGEIGCLLTPEDVRFLERLRVKSVIGVARRNSSAV